MLQTIHLCAAACPRVLIILLTCVTAARGSAADQPATQPAQPAPAAPAEPTEAAAMQAVKAYHAMLVAGEVERAVQQYYDLDQILLDTFEEQFRELGTADRRRLRELFFPVMEPVMAHPAMRQALARSRFGDYAARTRPGGRVTVEFVQLSPNGERRSGWVVLHHFDGRWRVLDVGSAGSGGFVSVLRSMWRKSRGEGLTPVAFMERLAANAAQIMKGPATREGGK